jgi:N-sulfoglucosamine sulfohydrolase
MQRPNILFAFADDWGRYASAYAQHEGGRSLSALIDTPAIDRIAREGALFTNAMVPAPSCTPCRSSVLSGRYFWQTRLGAILQGAVWDEEIPTFPRMLEAAGYHTGATYKVWGPGVPAGVGPFGSQDHHYNNAGNRFHFFSQNVTRWIDEGKTVEQAMQILDNDVRQNFTDFMHDRQDDQPFLYWWGPTNTHRVWQKGSGKSLWGIDPDALTGRLPGFLPDVHDVREDVADYLGECMAFDRGLGVILADLEQRGELDNTLVVVSGDHGFPGVPCGKCNLYDFGCEVALMARLPGAIPPGQVIEDMTNLMDLAPTFLEAAGLDADPDMSANSLWGRLTGRATPKQDNWVITGRERHVAAARDWNLPYPHRAIRTPDFLYIHNFEPDRWPMGDPNGMDDLSTPSIAWDQLETETYAAYADMDAGPTKAWMIHHRADPQHTDNFQRGFGKRPMQELYDLRTDPDQMNNVAADPAYRQTCIQLHDTLMAELRRQRDPRVCDDVCRYDASPFTDEWLGNAAKEKAVAAERLDQSGD